MGVEQFQKNPSITIKSWVEAYSDKMYSWALYKTNNKETSEDLVQQTFMIAYQSFDKFEDRSNPKTWLFGILNHKIADHFRKIYRNPVINESDRNPEAGKDFLDTFFDADGSWIKEQRPKPWPEDAHLFDNADFIKIMHSCMNKLPSNWFAVINLKYLEEKKGDLICQELEITPTNFWQILHRAKLQLRKCLEIHWFKK
ncbi:MAG: sigma-70 family RNA polymerase sigma factor [Ginsengibacter sp.]